MAGATCERTSEEVLSPARRGAGCRLGELVHRAGAVLNHRLLAKAAAGSYSCGMPISIRAVILATLAVLGIDILSGMVLTQMFGGPGFDSDLSQEEIRSAYQVLMQDVRYLTFGLILGTASTVLGG